MHPALVAARFTLLFIAGGVLEIAGGCGVWLWLREGRPLAYGLIGAVLLALFGAGGAVALRPARRPRG